MAFNPENGSLEVQMATRMQLILDQPMSDMSSGLVNRDFEGDFFRVGDTVNIVKPDINSVNVAVGNPITPQATQTYGLSRANHVAKTAADDTANRASGNNDARLQVSDLMFDKAVLRIDKTAKYAFAISDILDAEGRWDYESGGLDLAGHQIRKAHNIEIAQLAIDGIEDEYTPNVLAGATANAPMYITNVDSLYENVILPMFAELYDKGAITADGQVSFGSNQSVKKRTFGRLYVPTKVYTQLLKSKYLTDRSTVDADTKVETGKIKTILGLDINIEPALAGVTAADGNHVVFPEGTPEGTFVLIAGTENFMTKAGKVLPPEKLRSQTRFADEYHGLEIYGQKVVSPESSVIAYVTFTAPSEEEE